MLGKTPTIRSVQGTISQVTPDYIDVALATAASQVLAQLPPNSPLRVDRVLREVTTARQLRAIKILRDGYQGQTSAAQHVVRGVLYCLPSTRELATTPPPWTRYVAHVAGYKKQSKHIDKTY